MRIRNLNIQSLKIPFKVNFKHSSADRNKTKSVLVCTETSNGHIGFGEGCPREYVTGESISSCLRFFNQHKNHLISCIHSLSDIENWVLQHEEEVDKLPSAWCAIELSILDALSKELSQSVERTINAPGLEGRFQYTAILGDSSAEVIQTQTTQYNKYGFNDFKVKITGDPDIDNEKFNIINSTVPNARIRLDANNLWQNSQDVLKYIGSISTELFAIEEPLQAMDFKELSVLLKSISVPIILDESFYNEHHFDHILTDIKNVIINLRISKMGGILRSRQIAKQATQRQIPLIIGAQVGETSILTRAALTIANEYRENILAQEGAYGTLLLESDITDQPLTFGKYGRLDIARNFCIKEYGFQIKYKLKDYAQSSTRP